MTESIQPSANSTTLRMQALPSPAPLALLGAGLLLALATVFGRGVVVPQRPAAAEPGRSAAALPTLYVRNAGQAAPGVLFEARGPGGALRFGAAEVVAGGTRMRFIGASRHPAVVGTDKRPGAVNVLRGARATWRTGLPVYGGVAYRGLYPGTEVRFDGSGATWTLAPGADPGRVRWRLAGDAAPQRAPIAWQRAGRRRVPVDVRYRVDARGRHGFAVGRYRRGAPLAIAVPAALGPRRAAPATVGFSTFLGGAQWDEAMDLEVDSAGSTYIAGFTASADARTARALRSRHRGGMDAYVAKIAPDGRTLRYATFLGGSDLDVANALAVDRSGNAYVAGRTASPDFPVRRALQPRPAGRACQALARHQQAETCQDAFVAKLTPSGDALAYSTYLGGSRNEEAVGLAVDDRGRAYVSGNTDSADYPTRRALQRRFGSRDCPTDLPCPMDTFLTRLSGDGRRVAYSTYLGGTKADTSGGVAIDDDGAAYVTGVTSSANFPTRGARQPALRGRGCGPPPNRACPDVFVAKVRPSGRALVYGTYLGGTAPETSGGIAVDRAGNAHLTGSTQSPDFPTARAFQSSIGNASCSTTGSPKELCADAFVAKLSADGRRLRYSSFLGGNAEDVGLGVAVDRAGSARIVGSTDSRAFRTRDALQPAIAGGVDAFVATVAPTGALTASTFLGGTKAERANAIAVDARGRAVVAGRTLSPNFPTATPLQGTLAGDYDAFVTMLR